MTSIGLIISTYEWPDRRTADLHGLERSDDSAHIVPW